MGALLLASTAMLRSREPQFGQGWRSSKASVLSTAGKASAHAAQPTDLPSVSLLTGPR
jgi:hypothetical protein